jgi:hypothetical protein
MAGIPVHTGSPISPYSASKAGGATPSTAAARFAPPDPPSRVLQTPASAPATITKVPSPTYAVAQPGATASPASNSQPTPTATISSPYTRTASSPPSPEPGAVPSPSYSEARRASISPPPKAGEIPKPAAFYAPKYDGSVTPAPPGALSVDTSVSPLPAYQSQGMLLTPVRAQPPSAVTSVATPTTMTRDLSHPPGYRQDSRVSFSERLPDLAYPGQNQSSHSRGRSGTGILDGGGGHGDVEDDDKGIWNTAFSWAKTVGEKVIEGEEEIWKRINGQR